MASFVPSQNELQTSPSKLLDFLSMKRNKDFADPVEIHGSLKVAPINSLLFVRTWEHFVLLEIQYYVFHFSWKVRKGDTRAKG